MNSARYVVQRIVRIAPLLLGVAVLPACSNMAGIGGSSEFSCKAPSGVHCSSLSGNYHNSIKGPGTARAGAVPGGSIRVPGGSRSGMGSGLQPAGEPLQPTTLRAEGKLLRLWLKPWEDADNDLVDQSFVYLQVDKPRWQVAHVQRLARNPYAPVTAPATATQSKEAAPAAAAAPVGAPGTPVAAAAPAAPDPGAFDTGLTTGQPLAPPVEPSK